MLQTMAFPSEQFLQDVIERLADEFGLDVEKVKVAKAGAKSSVKITVDSDEGPDLDLLEELSEIVSEEFDALEARGEVDFGPGYTLELTTPGFDFPMTKEKHFRRNLGRMSKLPQGQFARLGGVDNGKVALIRSKKRKGKKGAKKNVDVFVEIRELADVAGAVIEVEFANVPDAEAELLNLSMAEYEALAEEAAEQK